MVKMKFSNLIGTSTILKAEDLAIIAGGAGGSSSDCSTVICVNAGLYGADTDCCNAFCESGIAASSYVQVVTTPTSSTANRSSIISTQFNPVNYVAVR